VLKLARSLRFQTPQHLLTYMAQENQNTNRNTTIHSVLHSDYCRLVVCTNLSTLHLHVSATNRMNHTACADTQQPCHEAASGSSSKVLQHMHLTHVIAQHDSNDHINTT
jgi:hypothetical protein